MEIQEKQEQSVLVLRPLTERIDSAVAQDFRNAFQDRVSAGQHHVVLNLEDVNFIDSTGLGAIISAFKSVSGTGQLAIGCPTESTLSLIKLTRMDKILPVFADLDEAISAVQP